MKKYLVISFILLFMSIALGEESMTERFERYAFDFVGVDENGKTYKGDRTKNDVGPKMAEKLYTLGIKTSEQMMKSDLEELFKRLQAIDAKVDPCELYAFRGAILDIPWWECKNLSKTKGQSNQNKQYYKGRK